MLLLQGSHFGLHYVLNKLISARHRLQFTYRGRRVRKAHPLGMNQDDTSLRYSFPKCATEYMAAQVIFLLQCIKLFFVTKVSGTIEHFYCKFHGGYLGPPMIFRTRSKGICLATYLLK